jgi:hypothetical protein
LAGIFAAEVLAVGGAEGADLAVSGLIALLEITNLRRTGGVFNFGAFGLLLRWLLGALFAAVTLRFNINNQTNKPDVGSEITMTDREHAASDETPAFLAVKLELRTPED